ncbi:Uncharacterised protein [Mycolicibacterium phlei]|uniref:hypothetical protein n=1 Tax=Mycobacteroides chelonae TaxID=1774 RepID=UPI000618B847|nr:hypothetical protein [Mycobacteroides chelonae]VEG20680.1 Uncharacterised protein [Mycolicibacterium phlei]AKC39211.1 hypothetical protein GR01_12510 [Mycobacteroides chelonae]ANB00998.1 hypothetical protein BB28_24515 [Mycobacteroides chelonae CCUG 47445]OLT81604.1 hypothetical protein BKG56_05265 [Mycobacteroides chelonae]ORV17645.1 hypothetical protein AWB96_05555 [Mycobacteroides chelonae]
MRDEPVIPATIGRGKFEAAVVAARIISLAEIVMMPGFADLMMEQNRRVAFTPMNLQWVSRPVYWMQRGRSAATLRGVSREYQIEQVQMEDRVRSELRHIIAAAAAGDDRLLDELEFGAPSPASNLAKLDELLGVGYGPVAVLDSPVVDMAGPLGAIAASADPAQRVQLALARWNPDFLEMIPGFAAALHSRLRDVRVCYWRDEGPALLYFVEAADGEVVVWVGWDPRTFTGPTPPLWQTLPTPARGFLRDVHPGFTILDGESFGLAQPSYMSTFAAWAGWPTGIPDWDRPEVIASTDMLWLTTNGGDTAFCTSPHLAVGQVAVLFENDIDISDLGTELDQLMLHPLRL